MAGYLYLNKFMAAILAGNICGGLVAYVHRIPQVVRLNLDESITQVTVSLA